MTNLPNEILQTIFSFTKNLRYFPTINRYINITPLMGIKKPLRPLYHVGIIVNLPISLNKQYILECVICNSNIPGHHRVVT